MTQIDDIDAQAAAAVARLKAALDARDAAASPAPETADLQARLDAAEAGRLDLEDEVERLRIKRDKDVAALDELIAQLKPLIEEV